jgi:hypothetical protein
MFRSLKLGIPEPPNSHQPVEQNLSSKRDYRRKKKTGTSLKRQHQTAANKLLLDKNSHRQSYAKRPGTELVKLLISRAKRTINLGNVTSGKLQAPASGRQRVILGTSLIFFTISFIKSFFSTGQRISQFCKIPVIL